MPDSIPDPGKYFDYNGSTPLDPRILALCTRLQGAEWGNSAASHPTGRASSTLVEEARARLAGALRAQSGEVYFTSGGTESDNWALFGAAGSRSSGHLVTTSIEHKAVLNAALELERRGFDLTIVEPHSDGAVHLRDVQEALRDDTFLVSVMWANNETGVCQPVREIGSLCRDRGILFHCDAVAAMGKLPIDLSQIDCDLLSLSAHKFHAPKGTGALYIREGVELTPLFFGCGHQKGLRSGTENTVGIVAMAEAARMASAGEFGDPAELEQRRQQLWNGIRSRCPDAERNGAGGLLPNTLNIYFPRASSRIFQECLADQGFSVAAGASASKGCASHVLLAMGCSPERASQSLRFSLGHPTTPEDVDCLLEHLPAALEAARCETPVETG